MRQIGERQTDINRSVLEQVLEVAKRTKALAVALRSGMESKCERSEPLTEYGFSNGAWGKRHALAYRKRMPGLAKGKFSEAVYIPLRAFLS